MELLQSAATMPLSFSVVLIFQPTGQYIVQVLFRAIRFNHIERVLLAAHVEQ